MNLRVIPTSAHGALDYVTAPVLAAAPDLLRLDGARGSTIPPRIAGAAAGAYSALTDYELGARRAIPMRVHLLLDAAGGAAVALTPWLSGSARRGARHWLPHAVAGATEIALALTTKTEARRTRLGRVTGAVGRAAGTLADLPLSRRLAVLAVPIAGLAVLGTVGRRRVLQAVSLVAGAVEEVADTIEDAAEDVRDAARKAAEQDDD